MKDATDWQLRYTTALKYFIRSVLLSKSDVRTYVFEQIARVGNDKCDINMKL